MEEEWTQRAPRNVGNGVTLAEWEWLLVHRPARIITMFIIHAIWCIQNRTIYTSIKYVVTYEPIYTRFLLVQNQFGSNKIICTTKTKHNILFEYIIL